MKVTYFALRPLTVGDEVRQIGDLVPEAATWPYLSGYITDGKISPVLVATLPEDVQIALMEWEEDVLGVTHENIPEAEEIEPKAEAAAEVKTTKTKQKTGA
jgi:hypothetical protein